MDESTFDEIMRIQRDMASRIIEEQQTDNKIKLMTIINELTTGPKQIVQKEAVILEAQVEGISEQEILRLINDLKLDKFIIEKEGYIKRV